MKNKILFILVALCLLLAGCGEVKRSVDRPNSQWICKEKEISFSVSADGEITNGIWVDNNQNQVPVSFVFGDDDMVSITNAAETEVYLSGACIFEKDYFAITVKDIYNNDFETTGSRLYFYITE